MIKSESSYYRLMRIEIIVSEAQLALRSALTKIS